MVNLNLTIGSDSVEFAAIAHDLQGNILRAHKRKHADHIFMRFGNTVRGRSFVRRVVAPIVTSAAMQAASTETGRDFVSFALAATGFDALEMTPPGAGSVFVGGSSAFAEGMARRAGWLGDPPVDKNWQEELQGPWHAVLIVANDDRQALCSRRNDLVAQMTEHGIDSWVEPGAVLGDRQREHFGFRDGVSQPILLLPRGRSLAAGTWNPLFPLRQALVVDTAGDHGEDSLGSYMVIRKLRQDIQEFKKRFPTTGDTQAHRVIGRTRDGAPLLAATAPVGAHPNDFDFALDPGGAACPRNSHVRKANPRRDEDRKTLFLRRGIPYGTEGRGERGLIFIAYNSSLEDQFETMQRNWINDTEFPASDVGPDALLGTKVGLVQMRGGEYFFVPSISALRKLSHTLSTNPTPEDGGPEHLTNRTTGEPPMRDIPIPIDLRGQGPITPDADFVGLLIGALRNGSNRQRYIDMASRASDKPTVEANEWVLEYLDSIDLGDQVANMFEPKRTYFLEALRVMGIRLRRTAALSLDPNATREQSEAFDQILTSFLAGDTW